MATQDKPLIEIVPLKTKVLAGKSSKMDFLVRITAPEAEIETDRPPLNIGLVLDRSGSMSGKKIKKAKDAACYCMEQMLETDLFSLTVFDDEVDVVVPSVHPKNRSRIKNAISQINAGNTTALHEGWVKGGKQVAERMNPAMLNRVILITDGLANVGEVNTDVIVSQARGLSEHGISTTTIGVGNDFNEDLLVPMAQASGGNNWFVESANDFQKIFETEMEGLVRERFTSVFLSITPVDGVEILDVMNDFEKDFEDNYILPNLVNGQPLEIIIRTQLSARENGICDVFKMELAWQQLDHEGQQLLTEKALIEYADEKTAGDAKPNFQVQKVTKLLEVARVKREAIEYMDQGDYSASSEALALMAPVMHDMAEEHDDEELATEASHLEELSTMVKEENDIQYSRKSMRYSSINMQRGKKVR
ncbi:putative von Willebrand factor type A [Desulfamplus magnetovallimortis]|uniref:Putative von Willebrand factor type A n=1 Tax=Desulfamplus magnetovallimortis TaxID=1246637 RepID=A0A1W1H527_9BACT|nr:VWA domain-containing protein [Desulfamplus magnetovallimortis]SLM27556.1 putative von Willebrand factor type A [Desulfamplus magnetovallimortis]